MKFLLDTNVISEICKQKPNAGVIDWLSLNTDNLYISVVAIEELRFGEYMMPKGKRRQALSSLIDTIVSDYSSNTLLFDTPAATKCAEFHEKAISAGRTPTIEDLMIAAIATCNDCAVVTRNTKDFDYLGIELVNPYK